MFYNLDTYDGRILKLVNQERAKVGADPLKIDQQLDQAADLHTQYQANRDNMTHTGYKGSSLRNRVDATGYNWSYIGENVAAGYSTPESVVKGWMGSSDHRENILNPNFEEIGISYANSADRTPYWTQVFGADLN